MSTREPGSFLSAVFWNALLMVLLWPMSVATAVITGRWLGPLGKGEYTLALLVGSLLLTLLNLGIPSSISYFLGGRRLPEDSLVKTVILMAMLLAGSGLALGLLLDRTGWCQYLLGVQRFSPAIWVVILALPVSFLGAFLQFVILAEGRRVLFAALPAAGGVLAFFFTIGLVQAGRLTPVTAATAALTPQAAIVCVLLALAQHRSRWIQAPLPAPHVWKQLAGYAAFSHAANLLQFLVQRVDVFLVGVLLDLRAVGLYSVAYGVAELLLLLPQRLGVLYFPRVAADRTPQGKGEEVWVSYSMVLTGTAALAIGLAVVGPFGIRFLYGPAFGPSVTPLLLLLPGVCAMGVSCILTAYLAGVGQVRTNVLVSGASLVLNVLLNLILIPRHGVTGAAVASSLTYGAQALLLARAVARLTSNPLSAMLTLASPALLGAKLRCALRPTPPAGP